RPDSRRRAHRQDVSGPELRRRRRVHVPEGARDQRQRGQPVRLRPVGHVQLHPQLRRHGRLPDGGPVLHRGPRVGRFAAERVVFRAGWAILTTAPDFGPARADARRAGLGGPALEGRPWRAGLQAGYPPNTRTAGLQAGYRPPNIPTHTTRTGTPQPTSPDPPVPGGQGCSEPPPQAARAVSGPARSSAVARAAAPASVPTSSPSAVSSAS